MLAHPSPPTCLSGFILIRSKERKRLARSAQRGFLYRWLAEPEARLRRCLLSAVGRVGGSIEGHVTQLGRLLRLLLTHSLQQFNRCDPPAEGGFVLAVSSKWVI